MPTAIYYYTIDVDGVYNRAIRAGGKSIQSPTDQFYGDRTACVEDGSGNAWWIATHTEDVSQEELTRRVKEKASKMM